MFADGKEAGKRGCLRVGLALVGSTLCVRDPSAQTLVFCVMADFEADNRGLVLESGSRREYRRAGCFTLRIIVPLIYCGRSCGLCTTSFVTMICPRCGDQLH